MTLDYLTHLRNDSDRFLALLRDAEPALPVPSCPEWNADDLLWHLGKVQSFWGTIVRDRVQDPDDMTEPVRPGDHAGLVQCFEESFALLLSVLAETDPSVEVWMWGTDKTVSYIRRRQAHEALIHRLDAELTVGQVTPLDTPLASDGIDEALTKMYGGVPEWGRFTDSGARLAVEATDTGLVVPLALGRWAGTSPNTGKTYDEGAVDVLGPDGFSPDAEVRGPAAELDAWLWGRADQSALTVIGDQRVFDAFAAVIAQGVD
jgi:uncharacterized protein (TIGR03083 family)